MSELISLIKKTLFWSILITIFLSYYLFNFVINNIDSVIAIYFLYILFTNITWDEFKKITTGKEKTKKNEYYKRTKRIRTKYY